MRERRTWTIGLAVLLILAGLLRLSACFNDLWLDEVWSLTFAGRASSALDVLLRFHHDNNHKLNTLAMYLVGQQAPGFVYRLPSFVAGTAAVGLAGWIARDWGHRAALVALLLTGTSYLLVHYASEARGYSLALLFALLSFLSLGRFLDTGRWRFAVYFGIGVSLGVLSHLTFLQFYLGAVAWSAVRLWRRRPGEAWGGQRFAACHVLPAAFLLLLYVVDLRQMAVGGGDARPPGRVAINAAALAVGAAPDGPLAVPAALLALLLFVAGLVALRQRGSDCWTCFLVTVLVAPAVLFTLRPGVVFERYLLIAVGFMLLPVSEALAAMSRQGRPGAVACGLLLLGIVSANLTLLARLQRDGRGTYREALRSIATRTRAETITIGSDHDFRNSLLLDYYCRDLAGKSVVYYTAGSWPAGGPEWFITHSQSQSALPPHIVRVRQVEYRLAKDYRSSFLSGWNWHIYRRSSPTGHPAGASRGPSRR